MNENSLQIHEARLAALYEVSSRLGRSLDVSEVLNQVMDAIIQLTGAERGYLMLYGDDHSTLQVMAARNVEYETIPESEQIISQTVIERAITTAHGVLTDNAQEDERFSGKDSIVGYQLRSIMCAPLIVRERVLGAVYVDNRLFNGVFNQGDLNLLSTFANQAAIAIENARLFTQTDQALARRVEELSLFQRIDQQLNKSLDLNRVLSLSLNWAIALTNADSGSIGLLEEEEETNGRFLRLQVSRGGSEEITNQIVPDSHPVLKRVLFDKRSVITRHVTADQSIDGTPATVQLAVPIKEDGVVSGIITLESQHITDMSREDIAFVQRLADRAAVAIKNARLYEAIREANTAKSDFISLVTHELRLPMTSIKGYTDLINSGMAGPLSDQQKQFLEVIKRNLDRMNRLVSDLSDINRIESGRMQFELQKFSLDQVVEDVLDSYREPIATREQTLNVLIPAMLPPVYADPQRIGQIVSNLVSNAHKYTLDGGAIAVEVVENGAFVSVTVRDTGVGISDEDQQKLFTQFFRSEQDAVRAQQGWGLGLSIVRRMVEAQGGDIRFESKLGEGSAFTFTIPLA